jgi:hypothetical protein
VTLSDNSIAVNNNNNNTVSLHHPVLRHAQAMSFHKCDRPHFKVTECEVLTGLLIKFKATRLSFLYRKAGKNVLSRKVGYLTADKGQFQEDLDIHKDRCQNPKSLIILHP